MKIISAELVLTILVLVFVGILSGCQEEKVIVVEPTENQAVKPNSETASLVTSVARRDGSDDDIIDRASCVSLVFPVTVIANGTEVKVNSLDDLEIIENLFAASTMDEDRLEIQFPIIAIFPNHTQVTIPSKQNLDEIIASCAQNGDADIECIDFRFPIKVTRYNVGSQTAEVFTIQNDKELFNFFGYLKEDDLVGFYFPIIMVNSSGAEVTLSDISTLSSLIKDAEDDCDEDDHYEDPREIEFADVLVQGEWVVTYFFEDGEDQTDDFEDFSFTFLTNGTFTASDGSLQYQGEWETEFDDDGIELELDFDDGGPLDELDEDWILIDFGADRIRLRDSSDGNTTYLTLERP